MSALSRVAARWHGGHVPDACKMLGISSPCKIYDALKSGVSDEKLAEIVKEVDPELLEMAKEEDY